MLHQITKFFSNSYFRNYYPSSFAFPINSNNNQNEIFDFRSDTVTTPTEEMFEAMVKASRDHSTKELEAYVAYLTGYKSALMTVSGTMANQLAIRSHLLQPPHSIICDCRSHVYTSEAGGIAYHSQAQVIPLQPNNNIHITFDEISSNIISSDDVHYAPTRVISLENTLNGLILPLSEIKNISDTVRKKGIKMHLDGARIWNASAETGIALNSYGEYFDSMALCFSKSLGAPIGSVLVGSEEFIKKARHLRKLFGGGWRQSGPLAAAAKLAIESNFPQKLKETHELTRKFSEGLSKHGIIITDPVHTNMVFIDTAAVNITIKKLAESLALHGIRIFDKEGTRTRLVVHYQITSQAIEKFVQIKEILKCTTA
ncbi:3831_t:CDS:2 [Diversispora eburnea]|uniref:3831_t:CDS:1 n=1 Tax=Diversispora eburnea TaxID=1213867 RepID=A0A9N8V6G9_9GLOM|nr:3831_t:CDS:2 [Diversispora eburnea]